MSWIESHQSLSRHRKLISLVAALRCDRHKLIGHLHELWWWGLDNADIDGRLGDVSVEAIALAAAWQERDSSRFVDALVSAGFIEASNEGYVLHDWYQYAGKLNTRRASNRERQQRHRSRVGNSDESVTVTHTSRVTERDSNAHVTRDVTPLSRGYRTVPTVPTPVGPLSGSDDDGSDAGFGDRYGTLVMALGGSVSAKTAREFRDIAEDYSQGEIDAALKRCTLDNVRPYPNRVVERLPRQTAAPVKAPVITDAFEAARVRLERMKTEDPEAYAAMGFDS